MRGVLLDGDTGRPAAAKPAYTCRVCGTPFLAQQQAAWQAHVAKCARAHLDEIRAKRADERARNPLHESLDPELEDYMLSVGRRMRREGRWERYPNEMVHDG